MAWRACLAMPELLALACSHDRAPTIFIEVPAPEACGGGTFGGRLVRVSMVPLASPFSQPQRLGLEFHIALQRRSSYSSRTVSGTNRC